MNNRYINRKTLPHDIPPWVNPGATYFITINAKDKTKTNWVNDGKINAILKAADHQDKYN